MRALWQNILLVVEPMLTIVGGIVVLAVIVLLINHAVSEDGE